MGWIPFKKTNDNGEETPQEAFAEYGYDFNQIQQMMNGMR